MKKILILIMSVLSITVYAQKEANRWYFGYNAGMDFSQSQTLASSNGMGAVSGLPIAVKGPIYTREGCFSISDENGNFLFASDGQTVYNRNLVVMTNGTGLLGNISSVNSGIVIPVPGDKTKFYIVTVPDIGNASYGIRYSIVDMTLDGGLGAVTSTKNILLSYGTSGLSLADTYENITVVGHANTKDFWMVSHIKGKYLAWHVTSVGFSQPIVSNGNYIPAGGQGSIKISPDGLKIAYADHGTLGGYFTLGDFNTLTGVVSNLKTRAVGPDRLYGVEFSPSGEYIYITVLNMVDTQNGLYIRHINDLDRVPYARSVPFISNIQTASDKRLYAVAPNGNRTLWVVLNPDKGGTQIASFDNYFLPGTEPVFGLPPFITSFFAFKPLPIEGREIVCVDNISVYRMIIQNLGTGINKIQYLEWDFGDGTLPEIETNVVEGENSRSHTYQSKGQYILTVTPYKQFDIPDLSNINQFTVDVKECNIEINKMVRSEITK